MTELDKDLDKQIMPVRTHLMQKESDRDRMRDANAQEDGMLSNQLKDFERDMDKLKGENYRFLFAHSHSFQLCQLICQTVPAPYGMVLIHHCPEVNDKIDQYVRSNKDNEIHEVDQKLLRNAEDISSGEGKLTEMKPELENLKKQVEDG